MTTLVEKYKTNIEDIDEIFKISYVIRDATIEGLKNIETASLKNTDQKKFNNVLLLLQNISDESIGKAERDKISKLFNQGVTLIVSLAENLLKDLFERLIEERLENIDCILDNQIKIKDLADKSFSLNRQDCFELVLSSIYGETSPKEKINLQNIKSIEDIFKKYFNIEIKLDDSYRKSIHFYYQVRHIVLHNSSKIDQKFINNLTKASIDSSNYKLNQRITLDHQDYEDCKQVFEQLFICLESCIN